MLTLAGCDMGGSVSVSTKQYRHSANGGLSGGRGSLAFENDCCASTNLLRVRSRKEMPGSTGWKGRDRIEQGLKGRSRLIPHDESVMTDNLCLGDQGSQHI